jgi:hypothetical protein
MIKKLFSLFLAISVISCKEEEFDPPLVLTGEVADLGQTSATFTAKITNEGKSPITESGFIWGLHADLKPANSITLNTNGITDGVFSIKSNEPFLPGRTHYFKAFVKSANTITFGKTRSFDVPAATPAPSPGTWSIAIDQTQGSFGNCYIIRTSFTLDDVTYFIFENAGLGDIYKFDHTSNTFSFVISDPALAFASVSCAYNDVAYIFSSNAIHIFDPATKTITERSVLDNQQLYLTAGFVIGSDIYVGLGSTINNISSNKFWKYSISENSWTPIAPFPDDSKLAAFAFANNGRGYVGGGYRYTNFYAVVMNDLWRYDPATNGWALQESLPFEASEPFKTPATQMNNKGYVYFNKMLVEYNSVFDVWEYKAGHSFDSFICYPHIFAYNDELFVASIISDSGEGRITILRYEK